jgi:hypothetical protein
MLGSGDMLGSRDNEDDYVTSIEFNECVERGELPCELLMCVLCGAQLVTVIVDILLADADVFFKS